MSEHDQVQLTYHLSGCRLHRLSPVHIEHIEWSATHPFIIEVGQFPLVIHLTEVKIHKPCKHPPIFHTTRKTHVTSLPVQMRFR
jgi:hypothetical protein